LDSSKLRLLRSHQLPIHLTLLNIAKIKIEESRRVEITLKMNLLLEIILMILPNYLTSNKIKIRYKITVS
jgi:hypothetical protein